MNRKLILFVIIVCYLFLVVYGINKVYSVPAPPKEVVLAKPEDKISIAHTEIFGRLERPQVIFDHKKHIEALKKEGKKEWESCDTCHPLNKDKTLIVFDFPKKAEKKDKESLMNAYHDECINCHKEKSREGKKAGPVVCADCHAQKFEYLQVKYPVFEFDFSYHDKHVKKLKEKMGKDECDLCHHTYDIHEEEESLRLVYEKGTEESCYYCHELGKKRGPDLAPIVRVAAEKGLSIRRASHTQCLNCHLYYSRVEEKAIAQKEKKIGPIECAKCHTGKYKTVKELEKVPRPDRNQPEKPFIEIENAKMKGVLFDHSAHEKNYKTCRSCHHETLNACKKCHDLSGKPEGRSVNVASAYHDVFSEHSCAGCHGIKKKEKDCAGCHHAILPMDLETKSPRKDTCARCHTGKKEGLPTPQPLSIAGLDKEKVKKEVTIKILEKEYEPAKFPHLKIIERLVKVSNDSKMGRFFHAKLQTLCEGCHHQSRSEAEAKKDTPPYCRNCHSISFDPQHLNRPKLVATYHRQCIQCHEKMNLEKPKKCTDCHKEKEMRPKYILTKYGEPSTE